ncbi:MAG TPA: hypothetical protein VMF61_09870 [Candidatus Acidoferrales bacterium]|nr:hypothetical protein [Candidatus Acidoferrales bacterium]
MHRRRSNRSGWRRVTDRFVAWSFFGPPVGTGEDERAKLQGARGPSVAATVVVVGILALVVLLVLFAAFRLTRAR